ncbi:MAG: ThiF family adenylyltransferase [Eubacteriales bacterium]|nr:ThiF family adenylyltransferase [Eubacteriales bacterium]
MSKIMQMIENIGKTTGVDIYQPKDSAPDIHCPDGSAADWRMERGSIMRRIRTGGTRKRRMAARPYHGDGTCHENRMYHGGGTCHENRMYREDGACKKTDTTAIQFAENVLKEFRVTVGRYPAETGGMLACSGALEVVDTWCFDEKSKNTSASYSYDAESMTAVFRQWKARGIQSVGFVHSHPLTYRRPSYDDIATAYALMKFFRNDFFYMPIIMSHRKGLFTMYFFVVRRYGSVLNVNLDYVLQAQKDGYEMPQFKPWEENYSIAELEAYYRRVNGQDDERTAAPKVAAVKTATPKPVEVAAEAAAPKSAEVAEETAAPKVAAAETTVLKPTATAAGTPAPDYFQRIRGVYPEHVLDKVNVIFGVGGARTIAENLARNGFRNYILIDGDRIAPSNIATQGVFISEMGMYKADAIARRITDINPRARVLRINRFLDDNMSDEEFENILKAFPGKKPTDYLIYGCTDSFEANKRSSLLSLKYGIPYIGAGMYRQGLGAEVIFTYPGVTKSCPRCLLKPRFEANENGYINDVTSAGCPTFATERLNTLIGYIALMILMYKEAPGSPYDRMLDEIKDRNFAWIRLTPYLGTSELAIGLFDRVFADPKVSKYTFMDETLWIPQHPDSPEYGAETCRLCGGTGDLTLLKNKWPDTRKV